MTIIDLDVFVNNMVPPFLRKAKMMAWVKLQVFHIGVLWLELSNTYTAYLNELAITVATDVLQNYMRVRFPLSGGNNVTITATYDTLPYFYTGFNGEHYAPMYGGYNNENFSIYSHYANEYRKLINYNVQVPITYQTQDATINAVVNKYRPFSKQFQIIYI
jgi:hypothetical protein